MDEEKKDETVEEKSTPTTDDIKTVSETIKELREVVSSKEANTVESIAKIEKMNEVLNEYEKKNQNLVNEIATAKKKDEEVQKRIQNIESIIVKSEKGSHNKEQNKKNADLVISELITKRSVDLFTPEAKKAYADIITSRKDMRTDIGANGGFLVPEVISDQIHLEKLDSSPILNMINRITAPVKTLEIPVSPANFTVDNVGEREAIQDSELELLDVTVKTFRRGISTVVTEDLILFSQFPVVEFITREASRKLTSLEESDVILGQGESSQTLNGLVTAGEDGTISNIESAGSGVITLSEIIQLTGQLNNGYRRNAVLVMNSKTISDLRSEQSTAGGFLWEPGAATQPATVAGVPYISADHMPDVASSSFSVLYGDLTNYTLVDAASLRLRRDESSLNQSNRIRLVWSEYRGGTVVDPKGFIFLKTKA
jgi:HK97 family phage major capsid protein